MITIGIPTYNRPELLRIALDSCARQTYPDFEVIVNDDTSGKLTGTIVNSFGHSNFRYIQNDPPIGLNKKLNALLEQGVGEWMLILCDDDFLEPEFLETAVSLIKKYPNASLIRTRYKLVDLHGKLIQLDKPSKFIMNPFEFLSVIFIPGSQRYKMNISGILFRRKLLKDLGGFHSFHKSWHADYLTCAQLGSRGISVCSPDPLCNIRIHPSAISSSIDPDYESSIASTLELQNLVESIFLEIKSKIQTPGDQRLFESAKTAFDGYLKRHLSRAFDRSLMSAILNPDQNPHPHLRAVFKRIKE